IVGSVKELVIKFLENIKKSNFLNNIHIKSLDVGDVISYIVNPNGELSIEFNVNYNNGFCAEIDRSNDHSNIT
ncbi:14174_t:CDS:1, partial [Dentiscutata heterogama]